VRIGMALQWNKQMRRPRLLLAEDDEAIARAFIRLLSKRFDVIAVVAEGQNLVNLTERLEPDAIVADVSLNGLDALSATIQIRQKRPTLPIVLMSGSDDSSLNTRAMAAGASAFLFKPDAALTIVGILENLLRSR
jgi:CheY-like chemotaxis protein